MSRQDEAERLRRCRETFALAIAAGVSMDEARRQVASRRWSEAEARLTGKRCGTQATDVELRTAQADAPWMMRD